MEQRSQATSIELLDADRVDLDEALSNRRWLRRGKPFPHVLAQDVFVPRVLRALEEDFAARLDAAQSEPAVKPRFKRMSGYDAIGLDFDPSLSGPFRLFFSRRWHDMIAALFDVRATGHMSGGLHHHPTGSSSGAVHNDLNPGWFATTPGEDEIAIASEECGYATGATTSPDAEPRELIRAIAVLFYLANPPWSPGDGGATGLYRARDDDVDRPAGVVPPRSNSLLAFECTPYSFHSFLGNRRAPRNCLVQWLHRDRDDVVRAWGERPIVGWAG